MKQFVNHLASAIKKSLQISLAITKKDRPWTALVFLQLQHGCGLLGWFALIPCCIPLLSEGGLSGLSFLLF